MKLVIFGLGREGYSNYQFLRRIVPDGQIILTDDLPLEKLSAEWKTILLHDQTAGFVQTQYFTEDLDSQSTIVLSPGIKPAHPLLKKFEKQRIFITNNTQICLELCRPTLAQANPLTAYLPKLSKPPQVIGITGTKGKSTTTAVIYHLLEGAGLPVFLGGNIGKPALDLLELIEKIRGKRSAILVVELSSHQLKRTTISPHIAVIQAITPEHLDYYQDFKTYLEAKSHIAQFQQPEDLMIFNADSQTAANLAQLSKAKHFSFSLVDKKCDCYYKANKIYYHDFSVVKDDELQLRGEHNLLNVMPGIIVAQELKIPAKKINQNLQTFLPLPHRLELVTQKKGVSYYNDSLSTTPEAAMAAIKSFADQPIVLIAGGFDRGLDYANLARTILNQKLKAVILLPDTGQKIAQLLANDNQTKTSMPVELVKNLDQAIVASQKYAQPGTIVLLSPGSASFNQFKDYRERGNTFKRLVLN